MCSGPIKIKCQSFKGRAVILFWNISARWQGILFRLPLMWLLWTYCQNEAFLLQGALHHLRKWGPRQNQPHLAELGKCNPCIRISKLMTLQTESNCLKCLSTGRNISTRLCFLQLNPMIDHTISLRKNPSISLKQFLLR